MNKGPGAALHQLRKMAELNSAELPDEIQLEAKMGSPEGEGECTQETCSLWYVSLRYIWCAHGVHLAPIYEAPHTQQGRAISYPCKDMCVREYLLEQCLRQRFHI